MKNLIPLAERMRPKSLEDFYGQEHLLGGNTLLKRAIKTNMLGSCIFFGPPGTGKTTLANIVAENLNASVKKLNAVTSGVADAKKIIEEAKKNLDLFGTKTYLLLDECHRWSKAQSDCLLPAIENGSIIFIGSTTENPFFSMTRAIVSRCRIFEFKKLNNTAIINLLKKAIVDKDYGFGNYKINFSDKALEHFANISEGDVRNALNGLELAVLSTEEDENGIINISEEIAEQSSQKKVMAINESEYHSLLSAFCKSIRGSDSDAGVYYMNRLIASGVDPRIVARRLMVHCSEDIGMADSNALLLANCALNSIEKIGAPEALINLAHAVIYACEAEKSNSVILAHQKSIETLNKANNGEIPSYLKNSHGGKGYKYPHDFGGYVKQQYLPNSIKDCVFYSPKNNGKEKILVKKNNK